MNKQKSVTGVLAKRSFKANRGRNIVAALAVILTTMMFTTLFTMAQSMSKNLLEMTFRQTGYDAQVSFKSITNEQIDKIAAHPDVANIGQSIVLGLAENNALLGRQLEIRWADNSYAKHSFSAPTTGRMPKADDEIALDTTTLDRLDIPHETGQTVTLEWRKDTNSDEKLTSTFNLCGYWEANKSVTSSLAFVNKQYAEQMTEGRPNIDGQVFGLRMAQVTLNSDDNIEKTMDTILSDTGIKNLDYGVNLAYSPEMNAQAAQEGLPMYLGMVLIFISGYLIIYNIFQISVTTDIRFFGRLKTLGTSSKQIRNIILRQSARLCLIGIPIGLVLGYIVGSLLVPVMLGMLGEDAFVAANPIIFIGSALFAAVTVLVSSLRPSQLAGKVSPLEALRCTDIDGGKRKQKKSKKGASVCAMAWSNLGRNKKRTAMVICSLSLGLILLSCFYAKNAAFDLNKYLENEIIADFELTDATHEDRINGYNPQGTTLNESLLNQIYAIKGLESTGSMYTHQFLWDMDEKTTQNLSQYYNKDRISQWEEYDPAGAKALLEAIDQKQAEVVLYGLEGIPLDTITQDDHILSGDYNADLFAEGNHVIAISSAAGDSANSDKQALPAASAGSQVIMEGKTYTVMAVVESLLSVDSAAMEAGRTEAFSLDFIIPADTFCTQWPSNTIRKLYVNVNDSSISNAQKLLDTYSANATPALPFSSKNTITKQYQEETASSAVMGNAISVVIALVGILNFINSMVTAVISRKKEFAMIQSIGMTKNQLCKMLICEGGYYAGITIVVSYCLSALAVNTVVRSMVSDGFSTFRFTLLPLYICIPILLMFAVLIPVLCFRNLGKQSIVEQLRAVD